MRRSLLAWARVAATTAYALPAAAAASLVNEKLEERLTRHWSAAALRALGLTLTVDDRNHGRYDDPPYLFVHLNQTSLLETFVHGCVMNGPMRMIINIEYALIPLLGPSLVATGSEVVVRQWPSQAKSAMNRVARRMREGKESFGMSIEGRRSRDGSLSPFKKGAAVLAIAAQARIVPFVIYGAREAMPYGAWQVQPGALRVVSFEAIDTRGMTLDDRDALTARLRSIADGAINEPRTTAPL